MKMNMLKQAENRSMPLITYSKFIVAANDNEWRVVA